MIMWIISIYLGTILGAFVATVVLIFMGQSWGQLPHLYLRVVASIQDYFPRVYPRDSAPWPSIIEKRASSTLIRDKDSSLAVFRFVQEGGDLWSTTQDAISSGISAIIQDDLSHAFDRSPSYSESLIRTVTEKTWNPAMTALFYLTVAFRFLFLFPVRLSLYLSSFAFVALAVIFSFIREFSDKEKTSLAIIYCRIYSASMGLIAEYKNLDNRPRRPGIAISNHLSPNDIQMLFADVRHGADYGFVVTGQKHSGIIWLIQRLVERLCPSMWLERKNNNERQSFTSEVLQLAKTGGPVLLFPEGYCSNNTQVLQFRKALFEDGVDIHPMAIRQDARFNDNFWFENEFYMYTLRCLTSWAVVYEVNYLPVMRRFSNEISSDFAKRCQMAIAQNAGITAGNFDGSLWYKKSEQARLRGLQQELCAEMVLSNIALAESECSSSGSWDKGFDVNNAEERSPAEEMAESMVSSIVDAVLDYVPYIVPSDCRQEALVSENTNTIDNQRGESVLG